MNWIIGIFLTVLGLLGLFLASRAEDPAIYTFGLLLFGFAVLFDFYLIHRQAEDSHSG